MNSKILKTNNREPCSSKKAKALKTGKQGSNGEIVKLECNFFEIKLLPGFQAFQYSVQFTPIVKNSNKKKLLLKQHRKIISPYIFNGATVYTANVLKETTFISNLDEQEVILNFTQVELNWPSFHFLNLIFQKAISTLNLQMIEENFYEPSAAIDIPAGDFEMWPGYIILIQEFEREILLCCEISYKIIRRQTVRSVMCSIFCFDNKNWKEIFKKEMINKTVVASYKNNRTYIIHDIDFKMNPTSTYQRGSENKSISYIEHFQETYNIEINDIQQPLLVTKSSKTNDFIYLIPELCRATGLVKKLVEDKELVESLFNITDLKPQLRAEQILVLNEQIYNNQKSLQTLTKWKLEFQKELKTVKGRLMPRERIKFGNLKETEADANGSWIKEIRYSQFYKAVPLTEWYIVCCSKDRIDVDKFVNDLIATSECINYNLHLPIILTIEEKKISSFTEKIQFIDGNYEPQLIFIVLPDKIIYSDEIELMCLNKRSIPVHIELLKTIKCSDEKDDNLFTNKLLSKMNCKVGGIPWSVVIPFENVMTIGLHIWRDAVDNTLYHGAFVATMDLRKNAEYYSCIFRHKNADMLSFNLNVNMNKALVDFKKLNQVLPQTIVFYRIKSGTYNLAFAKKTEVDPLIIAIKEEYTEKKNQPQFSYIMVNKANNTRLFQKQNDYENPLPGTIVDDVITFSERHDFYLISQHEKQGSATTTYYNVIHNFGLTTDFIQLWTWKMTHLYYNCTSTINCPAVCEYAQKLAKFSSKYMRNTAANGMRHKLYFL